MKYPITPEYLDGQGERIAELFRGFDDYVIEDLCRYLYIEGKAGESDLERILRMRARGHSMSALNRKLRELLDVSESELKKITKDALKRSQTYYRRALKRDVLTRAGFTEATVTEPAAIEARTLEELENFTQSAGMILPGPDGRLTWTPLADCYHKALDTAVYKIMGGEVSYSQAIKEATDDLARSGVQWIYYETGWHNRADVAARRAVMTCISQTADAYSDAIVAAVPTRLWEVSAHSGARDKPGKNPWADHKAWQGKIYSEEQGGKYPNLHDVTGFGEVDGLMGANCRHMRLPFWEGLSEREYTDKELQNIDPPPIEYEGRKYTAYEATQKQRQLETTIREYRRRVIAAQTSRQTQAAAVYEGKHKALMDKYVAFSHAAGLPLQQARMHVDGYK